MKINEHEILDKIQKLLSEDKKNYREILKLSSELSMYFFLCTNI